MTVRPTRTDALTLRRYNDAGMVSLPQKGAPHMIKQYAISSSATSTRTIVAGHDFIDAHWRIVEAVNIVHGDVRLELYVIDPFTGRTTLTDNVGAERAMEVAWRYATGQNQIPWEVRR